MPIQRYTLQLEILVEFRASKDGAVYNWRAKRAYLAVRMARFFCLYICIMIYNMLWSGVHLHLHMCEIISSKMVQRSLFWPSRQRLASERQQGVLNTTGRFAELANQC